MNPHNLTRSEQHTLICLVNNRITALRKDKNYTREQERADQDLLCKLMMAEMGISEEASDEKRTADATGETALSQSSR